MLALTPFGIGEIYTIHKTFCNIKIFKTNMLEIVFWENIQLIPERAPQLPNQQSTS